MPILAPMRYPAMSMFMNNKFISVRTQRRSSVAPGGIGWTLGGNLHEPRQRKFGGTTG